MYKDHDKYAKRKASGTHDFARTLDDDMRAARRAMNTSQRMIRDARQAARLAIRMTQEAKIAARESILTCHHLMAKAEKMSRKLIWRAPWEATKTTEPER